MSEAYGLAVDEIAGSHVQGGKVLDCGAHSGRMYETLAGKIGLKKEQYCGIEWDSNSVNEASGKGLNIIQGDLNRGLPYPDGEFKCVFALSLLEHLINPCRYLQDCYRTLQDDT